MEPAEGVRVVKITPLFSVRPANPIGSGESYFYDVAHDDQRFLVNRGPDLDLGASPITVVLNGTADRML